MELEPDLCIIKLQGVANHTEHSPSPVECQAFSNEVIYVQTFGEVEYPVNALDASAVFNIIINWESPSFALFSLAFKALLM